MTTLDAFRESVSGIAPPEDTRPALQGLWWAAKGDWDQAHKCVQGHEDDAECNWVHAHLHHQEGDMSNAGYWYRRAGKPVATVSVQEEWEQVTQALLARR
jgi:hypothetical protein